MPDDLNLQSAICDPQSDAPTRVLVTGIEGFVGGFLAEYLLTQKNVEVHGTVLGDECRIRHPCDRLTLHRGDLREAAWTESVVREVRPETLAVYE